MIYLQDINSIYKTNDPHSDHLKYMQLLRPKLFRKASS